MMKQVTPSFFKPMLSLIAMVMVILLTASCTSAPIPTPSPAPTDETYNPAIDPSDFVAEIDNPYFSLQPGTTFTYESDTEEGTERNEVVVTMDTKTILGVTNIEVWARRPQHRKPSVTCKDSYRDYNTQCSRLRIDDSQANHRDVEYVASTAFANGSWLRVRIPLGGLWGTVPGLLFEKKNLIPALQRILVASYT